MLALTDQGLAHLCIAATAVAPRARAKWLRKLARKVDPSRQARYYDRHRNGVVVISARCDPTSLAELLHDAGIRVLFQDKATLSLGLEELFERWELGRLAITPTE
jgi:hypothetical protein